MFSLNITLGLIMVQPAHLVQVYTLFVLDGVDLQWKVFEPTGYFRLDPQGWILVFPKLTAKKGEQRRRAGKCSLLPRALESSVAFCFAVRGAEFCHSCEDSLNNQHLERQTETQTCFYHCVSFPFERPVQCLCFRKDPE